ncbi:MAG: hypothetical protein RR865_13625 [Clostridia bacterium]
MKKFLLPIFVAICCINPAWANSEKEAVQVLESCLVENAPENWDELSVHYSLHDKDEKGIYFASVENSVSVGGVISTLEPCHLAMPFLIVRKLSNALPESSQHWQAVSIKIFKTGRYSIDWVQP